MRRIALGVGVFLALLAAYQSARELRTVPADKTDGTRIVSLAPNLTGILFDLGAGDSVVGVTSYCDYPPEAAQRESIGDFINPNFEKIVSLRPDLVLAERWSSSKTAARLRRLDLRLEELPSPQSMAEIYQLIGQVGDLLGRERQARHMIGDLRRRVAAIESHAAGFPYRPRLYLEIDLPSWTVGRSSFTNEAVEICGARNIFADLSAPASQVSHETIIARNPDVIVSFVATAAEIRRRPGWSEIKAVKKGRIIDDFNESLLSQGNQRLADGMEQFQQRLREVMGFSTRTR